MRASHISVLVTLGLGLFAIPSALTGGCAGGTDAEVGGGNNTGGSGSTTTASSGGTGGATSSTASSTSASTGAGGQGGEPNCATPTNGRVFAITKLYLGDTDPDDTADPVNGWKQYGFNIDGLITTATSTNVCQPNSGASPTNVYPDGDNGIDNSFGKNIVPLIAGVQAGFTAQVNQGIADGNFTILLKLDGLTSAADQTPLVGALYGGGHLGSPPAFDGTDCWPVTPELLMDPTNINTPTITFPDGALAGNTWTSGVTASATLTIPSMAGPITLTIHKAQLAFDLAADHKTATGGQIGGVLDTEEFITEVHKIIGTISTAFCTLLDNSIRQSSDIMHDGTQSPQKICDGISIGIGFKLAHVGLDGISPATPPGVNNCP